MFDFKYVISQKRFCIFFLKAQGEMAKIFFAIKKVRNNVSSYVSVKKEAFSLTLFKINDDNSKTGKTLVKTVLFIK